MDERIELLEDYNECDRRIKDFNKNNYIENENWAIQKYVNWISKNKDYAFEVPTNTIPPRNDMEKAWNVLNNLKTTLFKIAEKNNWNN